MNLTFQLKDRLAEWIKKKKNQDPTLAVCKKLTFLAKTHVHTQSERVEKDITDKQNPKATRSSYTNSLQSRVQTKITQKG
jgi:hypothetical protein